MSQTARQITGDLVTSEEPRGVRRRTSPALRWTIVVAATGFALVLAECFCRFARLAPPMQAIWIDDDESPYVRSTNPILRYELKPGYRGDFPAGRASVNAEGYRGPSRGFPKLPGVRRIVLLGDSVTEGLAYHGDEEALDRQLEALFPEGAVEVFNFGVAGYNTLSEIEVLRHRALAYRPDVVVLVFVPNDYFNFNPEHTLGGGVSERPRIVRSLFERSHLFRRVCLQCDLFHFRDELDPARWNHLATGDNNVVTGLDQLAALAAEHGFQPLIAIWPRFGSDAITDVHYMSGMNDTLLIETLAWARGIRTRRLSVDFRRDWDSRSRGSSPEEVYSARQDGMHPNALGVWVAASALRDFVDAPETPAPDQPAPYNLAAAEAARELGRQGYIETRPMRDRAFEVLHMQRRPEAADAYLETLLKDNPDDYFLLLRTGADAAETGDLDKARARLEQAVRLQPDRPEAGFHLGVVLFRMQRNEEALVHLRAIARLDPDNDRAATLIKEIERARLARPERLKP